MCSLPSDLPADNGKPEAEGLNRKSDPPAEAPDPFDPARLRLTQDFSESIGVKKTLLAVPYRKPSREWFVQVHPNESYRVQTAVIELKEERETYLVDPPLWQDLSTESTFGPCAIFTAITRQGVLFLWGVRLPGADGKIDEWNRSLLEAVMMAQGKWVRVSSNMPLGAYDVYTAESAIPDPKWPDTPFCDLLRISFKDRFIRDLNHPVLKRLRGEE